MDARTQRFAAAGQRGMSLIELMVGVVIGLIAVLVIYQTFAVAEGIKRQTISAGDAQKTGLIAMYLVGTEISNAGSGISVNMNDLAACTDTKDVATTERPFSVVIEPGADAATPDAFVVNYSTARSVVTPSMFMETAAVGASIYKVQSPTGFKVDDTVLAVARFSDKCERHKVTAVTAPDGNGIVSLTLDDNSVNEYKASAFLINLGPAGSTQRVRYDVASGVLRSTDLLTADAVAQPLASSIMNMKVLYGVDNDGNGTVDAWTPATGNYTVEKVLAATGVDLKRIKAVRIGMVVRSDEYDKDAPAFNWTLFECTDQEAENYTCPDPLTGTLPANYRYRVYETIVPLRNPMWVR